jgi:hypothetical protein
MNRLLNRINKWILITSFKSKFFEKRVRWQLHSLVNYFLYPEFRSSWNLGKIIYSNRYPIFIIKLISILLISSFFIGKAVTNYHVKIANYNILIKDSLINRLNLSMISCNFTISNLSRDLKSRNYLEYKIVQESRIKYIENLREVPDSIFFLMVKEADKYDIPYFVFFRTMEKESKFKFIKNSEGSSAFGYMQIISSTFSKHYDRLNLKNGHTQGNNIRVGAKLISSIHSFWSTKFKDDKTIWEYTIAEYGCGRAPMIKEGGGYFIPESVRPGVNYVMKYYGE